MSSQSEKKKHSRSKAEPEPVVWTIPIVATWTLRLICMVFIFATPWYYGSVLWQSQQYVVWGAIFTSGALGFFCLVSWIFGSGDWTPPWLTWFMLFLAGFAWLQSEPFFSWDSNEIAPPSVQLQRWALGLAAPPAAIENGLIQVSTASYDGTIPSDLQHVPESDRRLAVSVEPLHTRGAVASLLICGLMLWLGRCAFSNSRSHLYLFLMITGIGLLIAALGVHGAVSYQPANFLGLKTGSSFATFVSKNSAGAYLNVCIAGGLGLVAWSFVNLSRKRSDTRYRFPDTSPIAKIRGIFEDTLADLTTLQIGALLCVIALTSALMISLCRGAVVSAVAGIACAILMLSTFSKSSRGLLLLGGVVFGCIAFLFAFQLDEQVFKRIESIGDLDLVAESSAGRTYIWGVAWTAAQYFGLLGSGLGTFHFASIPFQAPTHQGWFYHAESLFAECGVELGLFGFTLSLGALLIVTGQIRHILESESFRDYMPMKLAAGYLIFSQAFHSIVDFGQIIPATYITTCILLGAALGASANSKREYAKRNRRKKLKNTIALESETRVADKAPSIILVPLAALSLGFVFVAIFGLIRILPSIESLAASETIERQTKNTDDQIAYERTGHSLSQLASRWPIDESAIHFNSQAQLLFGEAILNDFRSIQYRAFPKTYDRERAWNETSPLIFRLAQINTKTDADRESLTNAVGGTNAIEKFSKASRLFASGQTKSPLNWQLVWLRVLTSQNSSENEQNRMLGVIQKTAHHNAGYLLSASMIYRSVLNPSQLRALWGQAMRCGSNSAKGVARLIATDPENPDDLEEYIDIFPEKAPLLRYLADTVFTKDKYPKSNRVLWELSRKLVIEAEMSNAKKAIWLADAARQLGDYAEEVEQLRNAVRYLPNDISLSCRLASCLKERGELKEAQAILIQLRMKDPSNPDVKKLSQTLGSR